MVRARSAKSARRRTRASERGAAVFVVLLVIVMLTGIGVFATRAAALATQASGFERQMTQTHYMTEYGVLVTAAELSTTRRDAYVNAMTLNGPGSDVANGFCKSVMDTSKSPAVPVKNATCYRFLYSDLEKNLLTNNNVLVMPFIPGPPVQGGGLGFREIEAEFMIEMSDRGPASPPVAGMDLGGSTNKMAYVSVTLNATGQVRPKSANSNTLDKVRATSASIENARAHLIVGPLSVN